MLLLIPRVSPKLVLCTCSAYVYEIKGVGGKALKRSSNVLFWKALKCSVCHHIIHLLPAAACWSACPHHDNETHSAQNDLFWFPACSCARSFLWGHPPSDPEDGAEQGGSFSYSMGWLMFLKDQDEKWFTFLSSKSCFLKLGCWLLAWEQFQEKAKFVQLLTKEEEVHWGQCECRHHTFPSVLHSGLSCDRSDSPDKNHPLWLYALCQEMIVF